LSCTLIEHEPSKHLDAISAHLPHETYSMILAVKWVLRRLIPIATLEFVQGWPRIERALPNAAHRALTALERGGFARQLITQNVDDLHQHAGLASIGRSCTGV